MTSDGAEAKAHPFEFGNMGKLKRVFRICGMTALFCVAAATASVPSQESEWVHVKSGQKQSPCSVRVGVSFFADHNPNFPVIDKTLECLAAELKGEVLCVNFFPHTKNLIASLRRKETDFFISSSGLYRRTLALGAKDLAIVAGPLTPNPNKAEGSVILVRSESSIRKLEDLRTKVLAANHDGAFTGYTTALREFTTLSSNPDGIFRKVIFTGSDQSKVLEALLDGRADVGIVKTCLYETYLKLHPQWQGKFRVLNEKDSENLACKTSTRLYPNWVFAATPNVKPSLAREVSQALLSMPQASGGLYWTIGTDFSSVDALMRDLRIGPFEILDDWDWRRLWENLKFPATLLLTLILAGIFHAWRSERLIKKRTRELTEAHEKERRLSDEMRSAEERLAALQKTAAVGQMSSLIAHELRQPLASISAYVRGLERLSEAGTGETQPLEKASLALAKIRSEASRADAIVERVRQYAKSKTQRRNFVSGRKVFDEAVRHFRMTQASALVQFAPERCDLRNSRLWIDELEINLALQNLLKNAAEAALRGHSPEIVFSAFCRSGYAVFVVKDNGPKLDALDFAKLSVPLTSEKPEGLGLGLGIVRTIAEAHGGRLELHQLENAGIAAELCLPCETEADDCR